MPSHNLIIIHAMDISSIRLITFDCYGTLIDWETGMLAFLRQLFRGSHVPDDRLLEMYGEIEEQLESGPYLAYRWVLSGAVEEMGRRLGTTLSMADCQCFAESIKEWQPFPDTVAGLQKLAGRYRLGVVSNVDDDLFAATRKLLHAPLDIVVTAQQVRSYKPSLRNFQEAIQRAGVGKHEMLHAAQSLYHDIAPANALGLRNVWVHRRFGKDGAGATKPSDALPMHEVHSIAELAEMLVP